MRFSRLKLNNITSLRGEHILDFGEALGNEELFAITGATGSGKSSLLTAISLALYGNTYKKTLNQWEYVTQDEDEASIDLEFSSGGTTYRALWRCKKHVDKHGVLRPKYTRELLANGVPTDLPIEDVVGLNFEQFKKTIILNQGQFAEFLTATFTERKAILENLANAELLSQIGRALKDRVREMTRVQGELEARLEGGLPFSDDELVLMRKRVKELEKELPLVEKKSKRFDEDERSLKELLKWCQDIARYRGEEQGAQLELQSASDLLQKNKNEQREWQLEFDDFRAKRDMRRPQLQQALQLEKTLESKDVQEHALASKEKEREKRDQQWDQEQQKYQQRQAEIKQELDQHQLDSDYAKLSDTSLKAVEALMSEWDEAIKATSLAQSQLSNAQERMESTKKRGSQVAAELEQLKQETQKLSTDKSSQEQLEALKNEIEALTRDLPLWEEYGRSLDDLKRRMQLRQREMDEAQTQANNRQDELKVLTLELENNRLKKRQHELEHALSLVRKQGEDDGHCPACLQVWPGELAAKGNHHTHQEIDLSLERLDELERLVASEQARLESLLTRVQEQKKELDKLELSYNETNKKYDQLTEDLFPKQKQHDAQKLRDKRNLLQEQIRQLDEALIRGRHLNEVLQKRDKEREELRDEWNQHLKLKEGHEKLLTNSKNLLQRSYKDLKSRIFNIPETFEAARVLIKEQSQLRVKRDRLEQESSSLQERLLAGQKEATERSKERNLDARQHTALLQEIQHARETLKPLVPEGNVTKAIKALEEQEENWGQQKDKWAAQLKELEQKSETCRTRHSFMSEQLKKARSELERTLSVLSQRTLASQFDANSGFARGMQKLQALKRAQEVELAANEIALWQSDFFTPETMKARQLLKACETELIEHKKSLDIDAKKRQEMDKFKRELEVAQAKKQRWDALANVLGQDEFRGFALGLVEERLVEQTNRELEHLCEGRYQITLLENKKQSQDFLVVDHWRGGGERKVSTLSGGETFLVSLAMALSLAELTRGQTEVDAFFIDEGFGTLDRDSIDDVLEVLSSVQSRGKQIGLISHVKALTDRIPVNLHLEKSTLGDSKIRVIYN